MTDWTRLIHELPMSYRQLDYVVNSDRFVNLAEGSVRAGKTMSGLLRWLMHVADAPSKGDLVVCAKTYDTAVRNIFNPLREDAVFGRFARSVQYTRGAPTARILGRNIEVVTFNDERSESRLRGMTCAGGYVDEWSLMPETFHEQLIARCSVDGAQLFGNTNPDNPRHWLKRKIDDARPGRPGETDWRVWKFLIDDNPSLSEAMRERYKRQYTGLWFKRMILGQWVLAEGAIYESWDAERHVVKRLPEITRWISLGVDYGTTNPFAALVIGVGSDGRLYLCREWRWDSKRRQRQLTDGEYSAKLRDWLDLGAMPEWVCIDPSAASFRRQLHVDGLASYAASNAVMDGIRLIATLLALDLLAVHGSCEGWMEELPGCTWAPDKAEMGGAEPVKLDDHSLDAGRYGIKTPEAIWRPLVRSDMELAA